jgi:alkylated DNA repair protein (DNA oxidative demethylase)
MDSGPKFMHWTAKIRERGTYMSAMRQLFDDLSPPPLLPAGFILRRGFVDVTAQKRLATALNSVLQAAPPIANSTKMGMTSAAMTNCGAVGWWSDTKGYRYEPASPVTGRPWPPMPDCFIDIIHKVMAHTPWPGFTPDACLINHYGPGAKMGLHQDKDERDFSQPIVTVSLGDDADFLIGGLKRADKAAPVRLGSGDVLIMGGASRMRFHGIRKIHPDTGSLAGITGRYSLTFRKAL